MSSRPIAGLCVPCYAPRVRLLFSTAFSDGAWPDAGALAPSLGFATVSPSSLIDLLLLHTGQAHAAVPPGARLAAVTRGLHGFSQAFFHASSLVDPIKTARRLLNLRDELVLCGLDPAAPRQQWPTRVQEVLKATDTAFLGRAERLLSVCNALPTHKTFIERLSCVEGESHAPLWQRAFVLLAQAGVVVDEHHLPRLSSGTDLHNANNTPFVPRGDGSLLLLQPETVDTAAQEVAAYLSQRGRLSDVVLIGADTTLDAALFAAGVPCTGARPRHNDDELLQILPLLLLGASEARAPAVLFELLQLSLSPIPRRVAQPLLAFLSEAPSTQSEAFFAQCDALCAALPHGEAVRARIDALWGKSGGRLINKDDVNTRVRALSTWLSHRSRGADGERYVGALLQVQTFLTLLDGVPAPISSDVLASLRDEATARAQRAPVFAAHAGVHTVHRPACVVDEAATIVWWNCTRTAAARTPMWSEHERRALAQHSVVLPTEAQGSRDAFVQSTRPLSCARERLLLVAPKRDAMFEPVHPHALWDIIAARAGKSSATAPLVRRQLSTDDGVVRVAVPTAPPPMAGQLYQSAPLVDRQLESPSSMESLLTCGFRFALTHHRVHNRGRSLPDGKRLMGLLAHAVFARVLSTHAEALPAHAKDPATLHAVTEEAFAAVLKERGEALLKETAVRERHSLLSTLHKALLAFARQLSAANKHVVAVEQELRLTHPDGRTMLGIPDVVVGPPAAIIDLKLEGDRFRTQQLENGTAVQLAYYSSLYRLVHKDDIAATSTVPNDTSEWPAVAFFQLTTGTLLTTDKAAFPAARALQAASPAATMQRASGLAKAAFDRLKKGELQAPGALGSSEPDAEFPPPCRLCDLDVLCGRGLVTIGRRNKWGRS